MAAPSLPNFLIKWVYPAALAALNTYYLSNQIKKVEDNLVVRITEVEDNLGMRITGFETDMEDKLKRLTIRQTELERRFFSDMAAAEELLKDCGEKCEIDERSSLFPLLCYASKRIP